LLGRFNQGGGFGRGADSDAQVLPDFGKVKPTYEDLAVAELLQPIASGEFWRLRQDKIGLAGKDLKPEPFEFAAEALTGRDDSFEVRAVIWKVVERGESGDLAEAIDIVAVADFVQRRDQIRVTNEIADALKAK